MVGHGTQDERGQRDFWTTVRQVAEELPDSVVEGCFLEVAAPDMPDLPDIPTALDRLAQRGLRDIVIVPLLLFSAGHARRDIPAAVASAAARTGIRVRQSDVLGCHPQVLQLSAERFLAAVGPDYAPESVLLLFVARGSRDPAATAELQHFVAQRVARTPVSRVVVAFLAMAEPRVEDVLAEITATACATRGRPTASALSRFAPVATPPDRRRARSRATASCVSRSWAAATTLDLGGLSGVRPGHCPSCGRSVLRDGCSRPSGPRG